MPNLVDIGKVILKTVAYDGHNLIRKAQFSIRVR